MVMAARQVRRPAMATGARPLEAVHRVAARRGMVVTAGATAVATLAASRQADRSRARVAGRAAVVVQAAVRRAAVVAGHQVVAVVATGRKATMAVVEVEVSARRRPRQCGAFAMSEVGEVTEVCEAGAGVEGDTHDGIG
jgi:cytochrome bd-type quinol oxidase subunit 1